MNITKFQDSDKEQVFSLFEKVFQKKITDNFWQWRYSYFGNPIQQLMKENDSVIGHYCVHPIPFYGYPNLNQVLFSMSVMSHPEYRGQKIFENLAKTVYKIAEERRYKIILGFPNKNSSFIHFKKLGWNNLGKPVECKKLINRSDSISNITKFKIKKILGFSEIGDLLWKKYKDQYGFMTPRTSNYLKWRFELFPKQKFHDYSYEKYFFYIIEDNEEVIAYFILKKFGKDIIHLVDYFGKLTLDVMKSIIKYGIKFAIEEHSNEFSMWKNQYLNNLEIEKIFDEYNFTTKESESFFGVKLLDSNIDILDGQKWFLTMSDSDVY